MSVAPGSTAAGLRRRLGRSNLSVSPICFGTWQLSPRFWGPQPEADVAHALHRGIELGVNFIDTADAYGDGLAEEVVGRALKPIARDKYVLATKVYWHIQPDASRYPDLSHDYILSACDASLRRLKLDYIDLYQCHSWDPAASVHEIASAMEKLVKAGKIRAYGTSNWSADQLRAGNAAGNFTTCQPPYSLITRAGESDVLPTCMALDIGTLVYSSLHMGLLSGKYKGGETFTDFRKDHRDFQGERFKQICDNVAKLQPIAAKYSLTTIQLVLAATLMNPAITCAIVGIKTAAMIEEAAGAMGKTLSRPDLTAVRALLTFK